MSQKLFIIYSFMFIIGIIIANVFSIHISWLVLLLFIPLFVLFSKNKKIILFLLIIFSILAGYIRFIYSFPVINSNHIAFYNNIAADWSDMKDLHFRGVVNEVDKRVDHNKLTVKAEGIYVDNIWHNVNGLVLVKSSLYPEYFVGDELELDCKLIKPDKIEDFAYDDYLSRYDIYSLCYSPIVKYIGLADKYILKRKIVDFKDRVHQVIQKNIVEPEASILSAMLLARRRSIPTDIVDNFSKAGVSHLLAISGMHVSIISLLLVRVLTAFYLPKKLTYPIALLILFMYILMIGMPASAIRAGMMGSVLLIADYFGRVNKSYFALILVAIITLMFNPKLLVYDIGWQLSFLAVLSLVLFSDDVGKLFKRLPVLFGIKAILQATFAAQILTLPWIVFKFNQASLVFPIANILLLPTLPLLMCLSIVGIILNLLIPTISVPLFWIVYGMLNKQIEIVNWLGSLPLAAIELPKINWLYIFFIYSCIFFIKFRSNEKV
ncbi:MAG: ComEC/Rec2 family competence protein [Candidatus Komeilibacteria bacterium]